MQGIEIFRINRQNVAINGFSIAESSGPVVLERLLDRLRECCSI
jgi:hypothetical protein